MSAPITVTLLGTGSPLPDPNRAGPSTLVTTADGTHLLVDAGRGVMMRLSGAGVAAGQVAAVLLTHLHSDHITDLGDVITTRWVTTFTRTPLTIVGPEGTAAVVRDLLASLGPDVCYRLAHHDDLDHEPPVSVVEVADGAVPLDLPGTTVTCAPTDHRPVHPTVGYRFEHGGASVVLAGDTVPCDGLDRLAAGADALVHTVVRADIVQAIGVPRMVDILDYHSSVEQAAETATRAGVDTLILTHYVPAFPPGGGDDWRALAAEHFAGRVEVGDDLHRVEIEPTQEA
ncbi:MAG: ribonuclease Z [Acidimicrobiales bacterium]|nr:ribonuclease Z [Acidimicrobiales bacterium]